jgi:hypothetical protein
MAPCVVITVKGRPCRRSAMPGVNRCAVHINARPGVRSILTPEVADRLVALLRAGNYDAVAARACGVAPRTFREWQQRGRSDRAADEPYRRLLARVEQARAEGEAVHVARIAKAAEQDWRASAWYLERAFPERWARPQLREPRREPELEDEPEPSVFAEVDELARRRAAHMGVGDARYGREP